MFLEIVNFIRLYSAATVGTDHRVTSIHNHHIEPQCQSSDYNNPTDEKTITWKVTVRVFELKFLIILHFLVIQNVFNMVLGELTT